MASHSNLGPSGGGGGGGHPARGEEGGSRRGAGRMRTANGNSAAATGGGGDGGKAGGGCDSEHEQPHLHRRSSKDASAKEASHLLLELANGMGARGAGEGGGGDAEDLAPPRPTSQGARGGSLSLEQHGLGSGLHGQQGLGSGMLGQQAMGVGSGMLGHQGLGLGSGILGQQGVGLGSGLLIPGVSGGAMGDCFADALATYLAGSRNTSAQGNRVATLSSPTAVGEGAEGSPTLATSVSAVGDRRLWVGIDTLQDQIRSFKYASLFSMSTSLSIATIGLPPSIL